MISNFINKVFVWKKSRLDLTKDDYSIKQKRLLDKIVAKNRDSTYLKNLGITDAQSFLSICPVVCYDEIEPAILQILDRNINTLTQSEIIAFSKSSGTTSRSKFIPMTPLAMNSNYMAGKIMLSHFIAHYPESKIFRGKNFSLTGSYTKKGTYLVGDISALFTYFLPPFYRWFRTPEMKIATISDWDEKLEKMIPILARTDVRWIAGVPSWMSIVIEKIEDYTHKEIGKVWPHLEVFFYGGTSIKPFEKFFQSRFTNLILWQTYNASEGFFGVQMEKESDKLGLIFDIDNYYEFIAFEHIQSSSPKLVSLSNITSETIYELVITNSSGLYRYRTGDLVSFTSRNPFRFVICGRTQNYINIFGEELMVINTEKALAELNKEMDFVLKDYTIAPIITGNTGHHHWQIEFVKNPSDLYLFQSKLDEKLRDINSDYDAKRYKNYLLQPLTVEILKINTINMWLEKNNKMTVQAKIPKLWHDTSIQRQLSEIMSSD